jgi:4'-phosphopantetheinyl transferase
VINVYWLEQNETNLPVANDWLCQAEALRLNSMKFEKRRTEWRLGRWTAKRVVAACVNLPDRREILARIEIQSAPSGAPKVQVLDKPARIAISLSHRLGTAVCVAALECCALGCDLETFEPGIEAFIPDYCTVEERALVARAPAPDRLRLWALLLSAKESGLKALETGLQLDPRCATVSLVQAPPREQAPLGNPTSTLCAFSGLNEWRQLQVAADGRVFFGWWKQEGGLLRTMVADPPPFQPIPLGSPTSSSRHFSVVPNVAAEP